MAIVTNAANLWRTRSTRRCRCQREENIIINGKRGVQRASTLRTDWNDATTYGTERERTTDWLAGWLVGAVVVVGGLGDDDKERRW